MPRGLQHLLVLLLTHALTALLNERTHEGRHPSLSRGVPQTTKGAPTSLQALWHTAVVPPAILALDHVQVAIPPQGEDLARSFYVALLEFEEVPKPAALAVRGGLWLTAGRVNLHLGVDDAFRPATKAHPAFVVGDFDALLDRLAEAGVEVRPDDAIPSVRRVHVDDPFGNRLELICD